MVIKRTEVTPKNLALIRRMRMAPETLCLKHCLEAFPALQRVEIDMRVRVGPAPGCLDYIAVSPREHARLGIRKVGIRNAFTALCAEHPRSQVMFTGYFIGLYKEGRVQKARWPTWWKLGVTDLRRC
jgi:hypothetical protein